MERKRKKMIVCLLCVFLALGAAVLGRIGSAVAEESETAYSVEESKKLIVYTAHEKELYEPIIKEFEERTGIWVQVVSGGTNEMLERIAQENGVDSGDIMFGGGVDSLSACEEYFEVYPCRQSEELTQTWQSEDDRWVPFSSLPIVFIYNNKLVYPAGAPRSWAELIDDHWKGKIAFADPKVSGTAYTALDTMLEVLGREGKTEEEILSAFVDNLGGGEYLSAGSKGVVEDVVSGNRLIGITNEEYALSAIQSGADIGMVYPAEGTTALPDGTAIIKNAPHRENAELFMEFTVSADVQKFLTDECNRRPVRLDMQQEAIPNEISYELADRKEHQSEVMKKWTDLLK